MRINGIGTVRKKEAMKILTREGREAVKSGEITPDQLGRLTDAFYECYGEGKNDNRD